MTEFVSVVVRTHNGRWVVSPHGFTDWACHHYDLSPRRVGKIAYLKNGVEFIYEPEEGEMDNFDYENAWVYGSYTEETLKDSYPYRDEF